MHLCFLNLYTTIKFSMTVLFAMFPFFSSISLSICHSCPCLVAIYVGTRMCPRLVEPASFCLEWKEILFSGCHFIWLLSFRKYLAYAQGNNTGIKVIFFNVKCKFHVQVPWATPAIITAKIFPITGKWLDFELIPNRASIVQFRNLECVFWRHTLSLRVWVGHFLPWYMSYNCLDYVIASSLSFLRVKGFCISNTSWLFLKANN